MNQLLVTIPHSGEKIPEDLTPWLKGLPETVLMADVDRFVDRLYVDNLTELKIPFVLTEWHRYAVDLNRVPSDIDGASVKGSVTPAGTHPRGFHWVHTTHGDPLITEPMSLESHRALTQKIYEPFHRAVRQIYENISQTGSREVFHLDAHSMPSLGTSSHRDPGEIRAEIVVSDCLGKSCCPEFRDLVLSAYAVAGFRVGYNWPYLGGRVTEEYGKPGQNHHAIQVEIRRDLYMDERTKQLKPQWGQVQKKIHLALLQIQKGLAKLV